MTISILNAEIILSIAFANDIFFKPEIGSNLLRNIFRCKVLNLAGNYCERKCTGNPEFVVPI